MMMMIYMFRIFTEYVIPVRCSYSYVCSDNVVVVVIYEALCFDVTQGPMNGASNVVVAVMLLLTGEIDWFENHSH